MGKGWQVFVRAYNRHAPPGLTRFPEDKQTEQPEHPKQASEHVRFASVKMHSMVDEPPADSNFESLLKAGETLISSTAYLSQLVTLSVGPESDTAKPTLFHVHKDKLSEIPFFVAALRPDAFVEGKELKISFPEDDPFVFARFVEFVYEDAMFPYVQYKCIGEGTDQRLVLLKIEPKLYITGPAEKDPLEYDNALHESLVMCGTVFSTIETFKLFEMVVHVLCLSEKYGYEALIEHCLDTLSFFPIGTKEVALLAKLVIERIPDTRADIYSFLHAQLRLHRFRLASSAEFQALQESDNPILHQGLMKALIQNSWPGPEFTPYGRQNRYVLCIKDVTASESVKAYGSIQPKNHYCGNEREGHTAGFGIAMKGEVFVAVGPVDEKRFFIALNPRILITPKTGVNKLHGLSYPADKFRWLQNFDRFL